MKESANFIDDIINSYLGLEESARHTSCFIFPTRRACLIFRTRLAEAIGTPSWSPGVMSIRDFVEVHSGIRMADEKELLLMLYGINEKYFPGQSFTRFSGWGQMLLNDFDEVDKQLESPDSIFTEIREIRQLESHFEHDAESLEWIREFTGIFDTDKLTALQSKFAGNWDKIIHIYRDFKELLIKNNSGYEGLAYRKLLKRVLNGTFVSEYSRFTFAGFYGLSKVEEDLINALKAKFNVVMEWDADPSYISGIANHEAGRYFRMRQDPGFVPTDHFANRKINITVTGVPMRSGQAKYAGSLIGELFRKGELDPDKTAIILPDEGQLFPVLYSIPETIHPVNVTMGLPLRHTVYSELATALRNLVCGSRISSAGEKVFYHQHLSAISENPLMQQFLQREGKKSEEGFRSWLTVADIEVQYSRGLSEIIQNLPSQPQTAPVWIAVIFEEILKHNPSQNNSFDKVVCRYLADELTELSKLLAGYGDQITIEDSMNITADVISLLKLPFSGEPVKGLQVMGFLETRALDFETVIILSCNEDILPKSSASRSFIPFSIRKAFGLSTFLEQDASSAYHFYRLLHRAKNVHLVYDTEIRGLTGSEASRYILQLQHEFRFHPGITIEWNRQVVNTPVRSQQIQPKLIHKSPEILSVLENFGQPGGPSGFSSTSLSVYISCSLRFYYSYIAKIKEQQEEADSIEANVFGNILHSALEELYKPWIGKVVGTETAKKLISKSDEAVDQAIRKEFKTTLAQLEGNDKILANALRELVRRILLADSSGSPFEIISLEDKYQITLDSGKKAHSLEGRFDRVDRIGDEVRIIDYKSGKVQIAAPGDTEKIFTNPKYKTLFQLFFYAMVYRKLNPNVKVKPGFYVAQKLSEGVLFADAVNEENETWFEERMKTLLNEIHDPAVPFEATSDPERCEYCPYRDICMR